MHNIINDFSIFEYSGGAFFFNHYNLSIVFCESPMVEIIKYYIEDRNFNYRQYIYNYFDSHTRIRYCSMMDDIVQSTFFAPPYNYSENKDKILFAELSFPTVHDCNLRCKYCFAHSGKNYNGDNKIMSKEVAEKAIYYFINEFAPQAKSYKISLVSGGEPFLNLEIIKHVHKIVNEIKKKYNKHIKIWICTNGTILNDEIIAFLRETGQQIGISLDGPKELHDCNRIFTDGTGTYDTIKHNIYKIINDDKIPNSTKRIWGLTVLNKNNLNILKIIENSKELGIRDIQIKLARLSDNSPIGLTRKELTNIKTEYLNLSSQLIKDYKSGDISLFWMIANDTDYFGKLLKRIILKTVVLYRCGAGTSKISITADGTIYPCDSFVGNNKFILGNIYDGINNDVTTKFEYLNVLTRSKCKNCWARFLCGGDCYYNSYLRSGNIQKPDGFMCEILEYLCELAIKTVGILYFSNPILYKNIYEQLLIRSKLTY